MKKTLQINLGGRQFHINNDAYESLTRYIEALKVHFSDEGDSGKEIVEDIEQRIAELLDNTLFPGKEVIVLEDIEKVIAVLGKIEDFEYVDESFNSEKKNEKTYTRKENRRLYRDGETGYIGGVAAGLGAYFDIDPLWIRLAFVILTVVNLSVPGFIFKGVGVLVYLILWIVVPKARTTAEKLQMKGKPVNLSTIKESVNSEFGKVKSGFENLKHSDTANNTRNALEEFIRVVGLIMVGFFKFMLVIIGIIFLVLGSLFLAGLTAVLIGFSGFFSFPGQFSVWNNYFPADLIQQFSSPAHYYLFIITLIIVVLIPIIALLYGGIKIIFNIKSNHKVLRVFILTTWILGLVLFISLLLTEFSKFAVETSGTQSEIIGSAGNDHLRVCVMDNIENKQITEYQIFGNRYYHSKWDHSLFYNPKLEIISSDDEKVHLSVKKSTWNVAMDHSSDFFDEISYHWSQTDSTLCLNEYFMTDDEDFWMIPVVKLTLSIPENQVFVVDDKVCDMLERYNQYMYCHDSLSNGQPAVVTETSLKALQE